MAKQFMAGPNPVSVDGDLIYSVSMGPSTLEVVKDYLAGVEFVFEEYGAAFLLTDASRTFEVSAEARRYIAEWSKTHHVAASAMFSPNGMARAMLTLIVGAIRLFGKSDENIRFFATETEARTWLDAERRTYYARHPRASRAASS